MTSRCETNMLIICGISDQELHYQNVLFIVFKLVLCQGGYHTSAGHYAQPFDRDSRKLFKIGVNFSAKMRNIEKWIVEVEEK